MKSNIGAVIIFFFLSLFVSQALGANTFANNYWSNLLKDFQDANAFKYSIDNPNHYWNDVAEEALSAIELHETNTDVARAYFRLGVAQAYLGNLEDAIDDFNIFEDMDTDRQIRRELVEYYKPYENGDPQDNPEIIYGLSYLAFAYYSDYRYSDSIRIYKWLIEEDPDNVWHYAYLAYVYFLVNEPEKAHEAIQIAIEKKPQNDYLRALLALSYWEMGNHFRAGLEIAKAPRIFRIVMDSM